MTEPRPPVGGTTGSHPEKTPLPMLVAPTTEVSLNTIPVGCWRVDDLRLAFDSCVVFLSRDSMPAAIIFESAMSFSVLAQVRLPGGGSKMPLVTTDVERFVADPSAAIGRAKILRETDEDRRSRFLTHLASILGSAKDRARGAEVGRVLRAAAAAHPGDPLFQNLAEAWAH